MAIEILGMGCVALDETLVVENYPGEDAKIAVAERSLQLGGIAGNALVAATRLGARCGFAGTLGRSEASHRVLDEFASAGVDTTLVRRQVDAQPIRSTIIVSRQTGSRTVLYDLSDAIGATTDWPPEDEIRNASVVLIDHFGMEGMLRAAKIAAAADVPIVADFESDQRPEFAELLPLVDHLILARDFALRITGAAHPAQAIERLWNDRRQVVIVTSGSDGCWFRAGDGGLAAQQVAAIPVIALDTTGCGDVFHGAYAVALLSPRAATSLDRVRFSTAAAALHAAAVNPQHRFPDRRAVERLFADTWPMP